MTANFVKTGQYYCGASPDYFYNYYAYVRYVTTAGGYNYDRVCISNGARGVVTLLPGIDIEGGTGTYIDPYVVGPLVTRTN